MSIYIFFKLAIFIKNPSEEAPILSQVVANRATVGYNRATQLFGSLEMSTGVHALPLVDTLSMINQIGVSDGDTFWEIGGGECKLACACSAAANGGLVIVTELRMFFFLSIIYFLMIDTINFNR